MYNELFPWFYEQITNALEEYFDDYTIYHSPTSASPAHERFPNVQCGAMRIKGMFFCNGEDLDMILDITIRDRFPKKEAADKRVAYTESLGEFVDEFNGKEYEYNDNTFQAYFLPNTVSMNVSDDAAYVYMSTKLSYGISLVRT